MKFFGSIVSLMFILLNAPTVAAQSQFEETMYSSGKIYVVVAVVGVVLIGIFAYLIRMDKRLKKLEEMNVSQESVLK